MKLLKSFFGSLALVILVAGCIKTNNTVLYEEKKVPGLQKPVEVLRDQWGINHLYAKINTIYFLLKGIVLLEIVYFNLKFGEDKLVEQ